MRNRTGALEEEGAAMTPPPYSPQDLDYFRQLGIVVDEIESPEDDAEDALGCVRGAILGCAWTAYIWLIIWTYYWASGR